jgi:hypothetical protein
MTSWLPPLLIVVGIAVWLAGVFEAIGTLFFRRWAFGLGPVLVRERMQLSIRWGDLPRDRVLNTPNCSFKMVEPSTCLIRARLAWMDLRLRTPFPFKATLSVQADSVEVAARAPLFATVFIVIWLVGWTVGAFLGLRSHDPWAALCFGIIGWAFAGGMTIFSVRHERRRIAWALREIEEAAAHFGAA